MSNPVFIKTGHGYENHSTEGRCTAFDGFEIIAAPLHQAGEGWQAAFGNEARESRVYRRASGNGTDYGSHAIKLGKDRHGDLHILMQHGSGREVWRIPQFFDGGDLAVHIAAKLNVECGVTKREESAFAGTCCPFFPKEPGQPCPEPLAFYDEAEWDDAE